MSSTYPGASPDWSPSDPRAGAPSPWPSDAPPATAPWIGSATPPAHVWHGYGPPGYGLAPQDAPAIPLQPNGQQTAQQYAHPPGYAPMHMTSQQITVTGGVQPKSVGAALALTFFFGPFGMLYSTVPGALVMMLASLVGVPLTAGLALLVIWPVQMIWSAMAASRARSTVMMQQHVVAPGWQRPY